MELAPITEFVSRNWLFTILIGAIGWLWRQVMMLQKENAVLEAKVSSLEERNADAKRASLDEIAKLKTDNLALQQTIHSEHSDDAILAKYEFNPRGIAIHKQTKQTHCPACLQATPRREVPIPFSDGYWRCTVDRNHYYSGGEQMRTRGHGGLSSNPY